MNETDLLLSSADGSQCLRLTAPALLTINNELEQWYPLETGGVLLGTYTSTYRLATVYLAAPPPPDSRHGLSEFVRGSQGVSELLLWAGQQLLPLYYLGEWHTHPGDSPQASKIDVKQMNAFASSCLYGASTPVLVIAGGHPPERVQWQATMHQKNQSPRTLRMI